MNQNLKKQNLNNKITSDSLGGITQKEIELIYWIRNRFRWGEVVIEVRNGEPYRIKRTVEFETLD